MRTTTNPVGRLQGALSGLLVAGVCLGVGMGHAAAEEDLEQLLSRCAPTVHPETMRAVMSAESKGQVLAIADAGPVALPWSQRKAMVRSLWPRTLPEAVAWVKQLRVRGHTVSLGLVQINDRNLAPLGLSVEQAFEPCTNIAAGGTILTDAYVRASKRFGPGGRALRAALSAYNSGSFIRGERDGYVNLVVSQVGKPVALRQGKVPSVVALQGEPGRADTRKANKTRSSRVANRHTLAVQAVPMEDFKIGVTSYGAK